MGAPPPAFFPPRVGGGAGGGGGGGGAAAGPDGGCTEGTTAWLGRQLHTLKTKPANVSTTPMTARASEEIGGGFTSGFACTQMAWCKQGAGCAP